jgi:phosphate transport system substrate-binding protein
MLKKFMGDTPLMMPPTEYVQAMMGGMVEAVSDYTNYKNAIGYSFLYFSTEMVQNDQIKLLSVNDVIPTRETIQNNLYPFSDYFYAIYIDKEDRNKNIDAFVDWILSEQGQELILKSGYTPIEDNV